MLVHLLELRRRALYALFWFFGLFLLFFFSANNLYHFLVYPLVQLLPQQQGLIATHVTSPVFTPLKLAADTALFLSIPFILYQVWQFIRPGLYQKEQKHIRGFISMSLLLFTGGALFCFYVVLPFMFQFFISALPKDVHLMPDMSNTMEFIIHMLILFGLCFQVPLICLLLVRMKLTDVAALREIRPYVIVGAFIIGMLLTPPDVLSQIMLALPLCLLYELGIILALYCA
jgi:sec-independent protein translocase protein TatC